MAGDRPLPAGCVARTAMGRPPRAQRPPGPRPRADAGPRPPAPSADARKAPPSRCGPSLPGRRTRSRYPPPPATIPAVTRPPGRSRARYSSRPIHPILPATASRPRRSCPGSAAVAHPPRCLRGDGIARRRGSDRPRCPSRSPGGLRRRPGSAHPAGSAARPVVARGDPPRGNGTRTRPRESAAPARKPFPARNAGCWIR